MPLIGADSILGDAMIDHDTISRFLPFALATGKQPQWNLQRILEGLVIAALTSYATMYGVQKQLEVEVANLRASIAETRAEFRDTRNAIVGREDRIEQKLDNHIAVIQRR